MSNRDPEVPYTEAEAREAWHWVGSHGPRNSWTATYGTAARMIGRLLKERERLIAALEQMRKDAFDSACVATSIAGKEDKADGKDD